MSNVNFCGRVPVKMNQYVKNASAEKIAANINDAFHAMGSKHLRPVSGKSLMEINTDCFDKKTHLLTEQGKKCFDKVNKQIDVTTDSTMGDYYRAMVGYIQNFSFEGMVSRFFDTFQ
ncbi:MAG: hypothetical protein PHV37_09555 [Candidatus Gastranaerophilales bacterium]|nr:hypothetical protein [Candidatus Gastranaerophilales bacterium]